MKRVLVLLVCGCGSPDFVSDDFNYSDEGWSLETLSNEPQMAINKDSTFDGPCICGSDHGFSGVTEFWRFRAPDKYHGDATRFFGKRLTWASQTSLERRFGANDLFLGGRGLTLTQRIPNTPNHTSSWANFAVRLDTSPRDGGIWTVVETNMPATDEDMKSVLANVISLRLPGEWVDGEETTCLDQVYFGVP